MKKNLNIRGLTKLMIIVACANTLTLAGVVKNAHAEKNLCLKNRLTANIVQRKRLNCEGVFCHMIEFDSEEIGDN